VAQGDYDSVLVNKVEWQMWPSIEEMGHIGYQFNDSLSLENKKLGVYTDLNVTRKDQAAKVATNVMAKYLRPMYRNNILVTGRAMKPWDHVYLDDKYVDMLGGVEIERVVHHYSASTGWVTNIVPHAIVEANPGNSAVQQAVISNMFDNIYNALDVFLWGITILTALPTAGASIGLVAGGARSGAAFGLKTLITPGLGRLSGGALEKFALEFANTKTISAQFKQLKTVLPQDTPTFLRSFFYTQTASYAIGEITRTVSMNSMAGNIQSPVTIKPILFKGIPFEAGLNGRETSYYSISSRLYWSYSDVLEGLHEAGRFITDFARSPNDSLQLNQLKAYSQPQARK
jgi:hypothetical protein